MEIVDADTAIRMMGPPPGVSRSSYYPADRPRDTGVARQAELSSSRALGAILLRSFFEKGKA
jgi:hypothetical protein